MKKSFTVLIFVFILSLSVLTACGVLQDPETPSAPIEAIPLETLSTGVDATTIPATEVPATEAPGTEVTPTVIAPIDEPAEEVEPAAEAVAGTRVYTIDQSESQVRFELDEDLRGERLTVIGLTDQVAGQLSLDLADLSQTQVGIIQINARTLLTDNNFRNRAIQNEILSTGQWEFITFVPTAIDGLPASVAIGEPVTFTISGDLTIRNITLPAAFTIQATAVSDDQLVGSAVTVINREDFGLRIPSVPNVANVEEEVELYIDFTANAS
ncbi:MAG: YceI family protein [Chloroflexota bacterium]|jgi:polyisoprenoid-binding protein YceI